MKSVGIMALICLVSGFIMHLSAREKGYRIESAPAIARTKDVLYVAAYRATNLGVPGAYLLKVDHGKEEIREIAGMRFLTDILVDGEDIYLTGVCGNCSESSGAAYWKNGKIYPLGKSGRIATAICQYGNDIYISGYTGSSEYRPCYWKNGEEVQLEKNLGEHDLAETRSICADTVGVFVCGEIYRGTSQKGAACVWKNGIRADLDGVSAKQITRYNGKTYIAGAFYDRKTDSTRACYWIDGKRYDLDGVTANSISLYNGKIFIGGAYSGRERIRLSCCWVDGERHDLPVTQKPVVHNSEVMDILADANGFCASGFFEGGTRAAYWINGDGVMIVLPDRSK